MRKSFIVCLVLSVVMTLSSSLLSCKPKRPEGILSQRKMENVLFDYHLAQSMSDISALEEGTSDEQRYQLQEAVFRKHGISREIFDSSMNYYCSDLTKLNVIYKHLNKRMERQMLIYGSLAQSNDIYSSIGIDGDTANVWGGRPIMLLSSRPQENILSWSQACDSTWRAGDDLMWRFAQKLLTRDAVPTVFADLIVKYTNDSVRGAHTRLSGRERAEIRIESPDDWTPHSITGIVYVRATEDDEQAALSILSAHQLIRFHKIIEEATTTAVDSLRTDSLRPDSLGHDSLPIRSAGERRLSPEEFRNQQPVDQKIDIVKERPYQPSARPTRQHYQQPRRRRTLQ